MSGVRGRSGGHNRLPTSSKRTRGTLRKCRLQQHEPQPEVFLPDAPKWLSRRARKFYAQLGAITELARVVTRADGEALALAASALDELVQAEKTIRKEGAILTRTTENGVSHYRHPAAVLRESAWRRYRDALRAFGLDPQSRGTVSAISPSETASGEGKYFQ